jgi:hypothetical protein
MCEAQPQQQDCIVFAAAGSYPIRVREGPSTNHAGKGIVRRPDGAVWPISKSLINYGIVVAGQDFKLD